MKTQKKLLSFVVTFASIIMLMYYHGFGGSALVQGATPCLDLSTAATVSISQILSSSTGQTNLIDHPGTEVKAGDELSVSMAWEFDNNYDFTTSSCFKYTLPSNAVSFTETSGKLIDGSVEVGTYTISDNIINIDYTSDSFKNGTNRRGELTFAGIIKPSDSYPKETSLAFPSTTVDISIKILEPDTTPEVSVISKTFTDLNSVDADQNHLYTQRVQFKSQGTNNNVVFRDFIYDGATIDFSSVEIKDLSGNALSYTPEFDTDTNRGYTLTIPSMSPEENVVVTYTVKVNPNMYDWTTISNVSGVDVNEYEGWISSKATVYSEEDSYQALQRQYKWADITTVRGTITKWDAPQSGDTEKGLIAWEVPVYGFYGSGNYTTGYVVDTFPANTSLVEDSIKIYEYHNEAEHELSDWLTIHKTKVNGQDVVTFNFTSSLMDYLNQNVGDDRYKVTIKYLMKVDSQSEDTVRYENHAALYYDGSLIRDKAAHVSYTKPAPLTKTGKYTSSTAPNAEYTIVVNPASLDLVSGSDELTLTDTMSSSFELLEDTLLVNGVAPASSDFSYDKDAHRMTLTLQDATAYTITYKTQVLLTPGETLDSTNGGNTAVLSATGMNPVETAQYFDSVVYSSAGSSSSTGHGTINITKCQSGSAQTTLSGAIFSLVEVDLDADKQKITLVENAVPKVITTDSAGQGSFDTLVKGKVYMLVETQAPEGYERDDTPRFYAFDCDSAFLIDEAYYEDKMYSIDIIDQNSSTKDVVWENVSKNTTETTTASDDQDNSLQEEYEEDEENQDTSSTVTPVTGDATPISVLFGLMCASGLLLVAMLGLEALFSKKVQD
ncbi:MAG: prealbumin-like fold domain-containing protein [Lachnospiraceae bacterium]|nr:prealbumin-like fold domain-containing protein [Lachnospiraceae bacterium]